LAQLHSGGFTPGGLCSSVVPELSWVNKHKHTHSLLDLNSSTHLLYGIMVSGYLTGVLNFWYSLVDDSKCFR